MLRRRPPPCGRGSSSAALMRRPAIQVGAGGGRGRRGVRHLRRAGRGDAHAVDVDAEDLGHHLRDLDEQALPHLGAAMVQADRAVGVDMHQRAGLVQVRHAEGDAEGQREACRARAAGSGCVALKAAISARRRVPVGIGRALGPDAADQVAFQRLAIGRLVAVAGAGEVARAHVFGRRGRSRARRGRITSSISSTPCGPPKPRKAVWETVLVRRQAPSADMPARRSSCSAWVSARGTPRRA